jgi:DNA sulfur modification protein DndD
MIIKDIKICNFRMYYGDNLVEISPGLTLFLGDNGDGKSTFFDALKWLFETSKPQTDYTMASAMRRAEMEVGDSIEVSVSMNFEHFGKKFVKKWFRVTRTGKDPNAFSSSLAQFEATKEEGTERLNVDGKQLIDGCFDAFMQRFSMFKGESNLNVFDDTTAFRQLIEWFAELKKVDHYVHLTEGFAEKARIAHETEKSRDTRNDKKTTKLNSELSTIRRKIRQLEQDRKSYEDSSLDYEAQLNVLENNQDVSEQYHSLKELRDGKEQQKKEAVGRRNFIDLNQALLDKLWILAPFPKIFDEFQAKAAATSEEKRRLNDAFQRELGEKTGKQKALAEVKALLHGSTMLSWDVPDIKTMEEMIRDEVCKVCGHKAPKGSPEYNFMVARLEEYKRHLEPDPEPNPDEERLFFADEVEQIGDLNSNLSGYPAKQVRQKASEITGRLDVVSKFDERIRKLEEDIQDYEDEMSRLLVQTPGLTKDLLEKSYRELRSAMRLKKDADDNIVKIDIDLAEERRKETAKLQELEGIAPSKGMAKVFKDIQDLLNDICDSFRRSKEQNRREFLNNLERQANDYLVRLNASDFHGIVRLISHSDDSAKIRLYSADGELVKNPSGSQETTMYMSVLFAISDLTTIRREENYPLIFDAATSSFGDAKMDEFYNIVDDLNKQCIIFTKDFINKDGSLQKDEIDKLTCLVYRLRKQDGYDQKNQATLRTIIKSGIE